jgi:enolase
VLKAVANVNGQIAKLLKDFDVTRQREIDEAMLKLDGTENKSKLGANAILAVSLASARAAAYALGVPLYNYIRRCYGLRVTDYDLPYPMMNILNGGRHADWANDIQEFMIVPQQKKFFERTRCGAEIFHALGKILKKNDYTTLVGDEGGYAPKLKKNSQAFDLITAAAKQAGYMPGRDVFLAIDAASSEFYDAKQKKYELKLEKRKFSAAELAALYGAWLKKYPIISLEDPLAEDDWENWRLFTETTKQQNKKTLVVGDDLFTTNPKRLQKGIDMSVANAILIKLNQIGTLTETLETIKLARQNDYKVVISHRSGETCNTFIADLAVGVNADYIKTGSLSRTERVAKYNRLMEIEEEILK